MIYNQNKIVLKTKSNKNYWYIICTLFCLSFNVYSQQIPNYTQYLYNMQILNPAYVGARAELSMSLLSRKQWVGIEGAPSTKTFSINGRTRNGLGFGVTAVNDRIGLSEITNVNLDISYTLITSQYSRLAFGLKGGVNLFSNNLAIGITPDNDIYASTTGNFPNVGFGAFFYNRKFYAGLSIPHILETPQFYIQDKLTEPKLAKNPNYFFSTGALFKLTENVIFKPSTMVRHTSNLPISIDFNANFLYRDILDVGLSYRNQNSVSALFALIINKKYRIGYAYDHKLTTFGADLSSHEIILHLDFNLKRSTRWLLHDNCYF